MKKSLLSVFLAFFASFTIFANDADLFKLDYNAVQSQFTELNQLGDMVTANSDLTYSTLKLNNETLVSNLKLISEGSLPGAAAGPVAGIPSFLWGCVLGPVGWALVYIASEKDPIESKKAMWGCVTGTGAYVLVWVVYYVVVIAAVSTV
ncbi:MAG TPA: hypothetical protein VIK07_01660 [Bacteroidales bacterium]